MKLILASSSPRRRVLLQRLNVPFDIIVPDIDESNIIAGITADDYCISLADKKASKVSHEHPNALVIGADTIVILGDDILGKPKDHEHSLKMLTILSGKTHQVITGVCLKWTDKTIHHLFMEKTLVTFRKLDPEDIAYYIEHCPPFDKAGSYGIQDWSAIFVDKINGCYDNVVGLPVSKIYKELKKLDINLLDTISE